MEKAVGPEQRHEDNVLSVLKRMGAPSNIIQRVTASIEAAERRRIAEILKRAAAEIRGDDNER